MKGDGGMRYIINPLLPWGAAFFDIYVMLNSLLLGHQGRGAGESEYSTTNFLGRTPISNKAAIWTREH